MQERRLPRRLVAAVVGVGMALTGATTAWSQVPVPTAPPTVSTPGCHTEDAAGQPATLFAPGDRVVVKGEGFGGVTAIRITFVQGGRTRPVAVAYADELGVFAADGEDARIPATAAPGAAEIHAFSTSKVARCAVQVLAVAGAAETPAPRERRSPLVAVWLGALVMFGLFLLVVVLRRWRARRLATSVADPGVPRMQESRLPPRTAAGATLAPILADDVPPFAPVPEHEGMERDRAHDEPHRVGSPLVSPFADRGGANELEPLYEPAEPPARDPRAVPTEPEEPRRRAPAQPADDLEEFIYRDGKWRLRNESRSDVIRAAADVYRPLVRVEVVDAREIAEELDVPPLDKDDSQPPLLDPVDVEVPAWEPVAPPVHESPAVRSDRAPTDDAVSDTVARLVENTKDWTHRSGEHYSSRATS